MVMYYDSTIMSTRLPEDPWTRSTHRPSNLELETSGSGGSRQDGTPQTGLREPSRTPTPSNPTRQGTLNSLIIPSCGTCKMITVAMIGGLSRGCSSWHVFGSVGPVGRGRCQLGSPPPARPHTWVEVTEAPTERGARPAGRSCRCSTQAARRIGSDSASCARDCPRRARFVSGR